LGNGPPKKLSERRPRHPEENMAIGEVYKLYKLWRESQRIKELSEKTVGIINRVDQLFRDYAEWQSNKSEKQLEEIRQRMRHLKGELTSLATPSPSIPRLRPDAIQDTFRRDVESAIVAEAARMELMRIYWAQDSGRLPNDGGPAWPPTRARFKSGRDAFHQQALKLSVAAYRLNGEIQDAQKIQDKLRDVQKDPYFTRDQMDELEADYNGSLKYEKDLRSNQRRFEAMAKAFEQAAINLDKLIEVGDAAYKARKE
jgi:hypothetical protein